MRTPKQLRRVGLAAPQVRFEMRVLNGAFLQIAAALPRRPEPAHAWHNRARADGRVPHPNHDTILLCRQAMHDAIETGNDNVTRTTRLSIEDYFQRCSDAALDVGTVLAEDVCVTEVVEGECRSVAAIVAANERPSPSSVEAARACLVNSLDRCSSYLRSMGTRQRTDAQFGD